MMLPIRLLFALLLLVATGYSVATHADEGFKPCRIEVVDADSGWPVPLVKLETVHQVRMYSDNAGNVAFDLPELMGTPTWLSVDGNGYEVPADGFGIRGVRVVPKQGETLRIEVKRSLPAKRLGRITGAGIFGESQQLGLHRDWREQGLLGCDSVQIAPYRGKQFWIWGDTALAHYPLGLFHASSARTPLQPLKSLKPPVQLRYDYFRSDDERPREVCKMAGDGPTWLSGMVTLPDAEGNQRLVGYFVKVTQSMETTRCGLCEWNDEKESFEEIHELWKKVPGSTSAPKVVPQGHPVLDIDSDGKEWLLFGDPFPTLRCKPTFEAWSNPNNWQELMPQKELDTRDGKSVSPHRGSIAWNDYRKKWITVFTRFGGEKGMLSEIYYAEAPQPTGPWGSAIKVAEFKNYTIYNPRLHADFTPKGSPIVLFEGTLSQMFAGPTQIVPRHDYNQVLYRLDLDDPLLGLE